jgi:outer membrane protein insertion porin family
LKEKHLNSINFNGGVSGIGGSFLGLGYSTNNFLGLGESMNVTLQGGTRQSTYQFAFTEPYLNNKPVTTGFTAFSTRLTYDQARDVYGINPTNIPAGSALSSRLNFQQNHAGFNFLISDPLRVFHRVGLTYQFDNSQTTAVNAATQAYFAGIQAQQRQAFVSSNGGSYSTFYARRLTPTYSFNSVNNPYNPNRGHSFNASIEFTGGFLGGNVSFYRPSIQFTGFKPVNNGRNVIAVRITASHVQGFSDVSVPYYERFFAGGDFDIRGFDFREISPIAWTTQTISVPGALGTVTQQTIDNIVYVGGDTQGIFNFEYRIPIAGPVTLAPFMDVGNSWVASPRELTRSITDSTGVTTLTRVNFLPGTNSGIRMSTGLELQVIMPVIQAPFRLVYALNPFRIDQTFYGPLTGAPIGIHEPAHTFKFTVGRTF